MSEVDVAELATAHAEGAFVLDVREPQEYVLGHVPGAVLVPMGQLPGRLAEIPAHEPVYVICASGNRSRTVRDFLRAAGVDARTVNGGTRAWAAGGRPLVRGPEADVT